MPKETFLKLSKEKQQRIINSAKKEFARVPIQDVSIKNIVEDAEIARGSFYQYFENKEDLLIYILKEKTEEINQKIENKIQQEKIDLFDYYVYLYDILVETFVDNDERKLFKQIFENIKSSEDSNIFNLIKNIKPQNIIKPNNRLDIDNLKIMNKEDFKIICDMMNIITKKAIINNFKDNFENKNRENFLTQIKYLKYGILKKEEKNV